MLSFSRCSFRGAKRVCGWGPAGEAYIAPQSL